MENEHSISKYLNQTVYANIGVSSIHGVGVIAIRNIQKGTVITDYNPYHMKGDLKAFEIGQAEFDLILPEIQEIIKDKVLWPRGVKKYMFFSPNHEVNLQGFMNHSEEPNTNGSIALKDIEAGEELTENYFKAYPNGLSSMNEMHFSKKGLIDKG